MIGKLLYVLMLDKILVILNIMKLIKVLIGEPQVALHN